MKFLNHACIRNLSYRHHLVEWVESGEHGLDGAPLVLLLNEPLEDAVERELLLHLLRSRQVVVDGRRLDRLGPLDHQSRIPLALRWVLRDDVRHFGRLVFTFYRESADLIRSSTEMSEPGTLKWPIRRYSP